MFEKTSFNPGVKTVNFPDFNNKINTIFSIFYVNSMKILHLKMKLVAKPIYQTTFARKDLEDYNTLKHNRII